MLLHVCDDLAELHPEDHGKQSSSHVQSLFAVVVSVIFSCPAKSSLDKSVGHVSSEVCFFELIPSLDSNVRQHIILEYILGELDSLFSGVLVDWSTHLSNIVETIVLSLVSLGFFERWSECFRHRSIALVAQYHVEYLLLIVTPKSSEQNNHWDVCPDLRDGSVDPAASV